MIKVETKTVQAWGQFSGERHTINVFKLSAPLYSIEGEENLKIYKLTQREFDYQFYQYYGYSFKDFVSQNPLALNSRKMFGINHEDQICDMCSTKLGESISLLVNHVGDGWFEPYQAWCDNCSNKLAAKHPLKKA